MILNHREWLHTWKHSARDTTQQTSSTNSAIKTLIYQCTPIIECENWGRVCKERYAIAILDSTQFTEQCSMPWSACIDLVEDWWTIDKAPTVTASVMLGPPWVLVFQSHLICCCNFNFPTISLFLSPTIILSWPGMFAITSSSSSSIIDQLSLSIPLLYYFLMCSNEAHSGRCRGKSQLQLLSSFALICWRRVASHCLRFKGWTIVLLDMFHQLLILSVSLIRRLISWSTSALEALILPRHAVKPRWSFWRIYQSQ